MTAEAKHAPGDVRYYELKRVVIPAIPSEFRLVTAATITCGLCNRMIAGMGGPGDGAICVPCGDALKRGQLRGAVKWDRDDEKGA